MAAQNSASQNQGTTWIASTAENNHHSITTRSLQRCAMRSMMTAMLVMALGVPLHITTPDVHAVHSVGYGVLALVSLSALLTLLSFWIARHVLSDTWRRLCQASLCCNDLVMLGAIGAFVASWPALFNHAAPMYFDVAAMALAWLVAGQSQESEIQQRFAAISEQLSPLDIQTPPVAPEADSPMAERGVIWLGVIVLGFASATVGLHVIRGYSVLNSSLTALATIAAACPCTLGIAASSACAVGAERAAAVGWLIPSGLMLRQDIAADERLRLVLRLGAAEPESLRAIGRSVRSAIRWNYLWAVGFNLASLPFALFDPIPALVPAATMLIARLLISLTNRRIHA